MDANEIRAEIKRLEKKLNDVEQKKRAAQKDQEDTEAAIRKIQKGIEELETEIQSNLSRIRERISQVMGRTKFKLRYCEHAEQILRGTDMSAAVGAYEEGLRAAKKAYLDLDARIEEYQAGSRELKRQINTLKNQLAALEREEADEP